MGWEGKTGDTGWNGIGSNGCSLKRAACCSLAAQAGLAWPARPSTPDEPTLRHLAHLYCAPGAALVGSSAGLCSALLAAASHLQ